MRSFLLQINLLLTYQMFEEVHVYVYIYNDQIKSCVELEEVKE